MKLEDFLFEKKKRRKKRGTILMRILFDSPKYQKEMRYADKQIRKSKALIEESQRLRRLSL